eukprot:3293434-Lingulodinium_polyedra.AAC.1
MNTVNPWPASACGLLPCNMGAWPTSAPPPSTGQAGASDAARAIRTSPTKENKRAARYQNGDAVAHGRG